jgi:hypothetical protein
MPTRCFEEIQRAASVHFEIVERTVFGEIVRWLCGAVNDQVRLELLHEIQNGNAIANIDRMMLEPSRDAAETFQIPRRVAVWTEELTTHVVIDAGDSPSQVVEVRDRL